MNDKFTSDIAFTPAVKSQQQRRGSRAGYQKLMQKYDLETVEMATAKLTARIEELEAELAGLKKATG